MDFLLLPFLSTSPHFYFLFLRAHLTSPHPTLLSHHLPSFLSSTLLTYLTPLHQPTMGRSAEAYTTSLADPVLLDKIDRLFACNVGEYIDLPQLVVVGDQSSGKSSVLEGLTKLPFPRDTGLCTRFATQIIFRRNKDLPDRVIEASIIPAPDSDSDRAAQLQQWAEPVMKGLDARSFENIMSQVIPNALLQCSTESNTNNRCTRSWACHLQPSQTSLPFQRMFFASKSPVQRRTI